MARGPWRARITMRPQIESGRKTAINSGYRAIWHTDPEIDLLTGYQLGDAVLEFEPDAFSFTASFEGRIYPLHKEFWRELVDVGATVYGYEGPHLLMEAQLLERLDD